MARQRNRGTWTVIGSVKPLGKTRLVKKTVPRPWSPFRIRSYAMKRLQFKPEELVIHRRPSGRRNIGEDPREAMAIPKSRVRGTLPERIVYRKFLSRRMSEPSDFDFQSSLDGGRLEVGGIVADFLLRSTRMIVRVQGPTHFTAGGMRKDKAETQRLAELGWTTFDLPESIVYDPLQLEQWFRRYIDVRQSLGGRMPLFGLPQAGAMVSLTTGDMNFAWTATEMNRFMELADRVMNLESDLERITAGRVITVNGLSDVDTNLGLVQAGEFRCGNQKAPAYGFTGVRIGYPPFAYNNELWHIAGVNNDVLQFGLNAVSGKAMAGGGAVVLDENGMTIFIDTYSDEGATVEQTIAWKDKVDTSKTVASIQGWLDSGKTSAWLQLCAGGNQDLPPYYSPLVADADAIAEIAALSEGTTSSWSIWLDLFAVSDVTGDELVVGVTAGKPTAWKYPLTIWHNFGTGRNSWLSIDAKYSMGIDDNGEDFLIASNLDIMYPGQNLVRFDGRISPLSITINDDGRDLDFRVESAGDANCLFVDGGNDAVCIGTATQAAKLTVANTGAVYTIASTSNTAGYGVNVDNSVAGGAASGGVLKLRAAITPTTGNRLGTVSFQAITTGTTYVPTARIDALALESWDSDSAGGLLGFYCVPSGANSTTLQEVLRVSAAECVFNEGSADQDFRVESDGNANALFVDGGRNAVGLLGAPANDNSVSVYGPASGMTQLLIMGDQTSAVGANLHVGLSAAGNQYAYIDLIGDTTYTDYGFRMIRFNTGANAANLLATRGTGGLAIITVEAGAISFYTNNTLRGYWHPATADLIPYGTPGGNLGVAGGYWNDVSYKTLTDRGCLGFYDAGVELTTGEVVSDMEALRRARPHPTLKTVNGAPRIDYASLPLHVYKPAPIAEEDIYEPEPPDPGPGSDWVKPKKKVRFRKGEKAGDDGAELTALVSIMLGAMKEIDARLSTLEAQ